MRETEGRPNKYMVLLCVAIGTILSGYVSSSIDIAMPNIMNTFGFNMDTVVWVLLGYMIPYGATLPITGKLGDQFGRKKLYIIGLIFFTLATMLVGLAWNQTSVVVFRILQGIGSGLLFPNAMALVSDAFPANERGQALGLWGAIAAAGSTLGPTIGGYIVEYVNWRLLFSSVVPVSVLGIILAFTILEETETLDTSGKIDLPGGLLLMTSLSTLLIALNQGGKEGWTSPYILGLLTVTVLAMAAFIYVESHVASPLVDLSLFRNRTFSASNLVGFLTFMTLFGGLFLLPFFLRNILGYSPIRAGISLFPLVGSLIVLAPLGGKLADKVGGRVPTMLGMSLVCVALYSFHTMTDQTTYAPIGLKLVILGAGLALTMSPLSNGVMASLPKDKVGVGSGVFNLFKNVGGSVGVAIMGTMLDRRQYFHSQAISSYLTGTAGGAAKYVAALQAGMVQNGMPAAQAHAAALTVINGLLTKQAAVQAFGDVFLITAALSAVGVIAALLIEKQPAQKTSLEIPTEAGEKAVATA